MIEPATLRRPLPQGIRKRRSRAKPSLFYSPTLAIRQDHSRLNALPASLARSLSCLLFRQADIASTIAVRQYFATELSDNRWE
jgi:hypothetical protein